MRTSSRPRAAGRPRDLVAVPADAGPGVFHVPLSCGGSAWPHVGTGFGYRAEPAVTGDGTRRLVVALFSNTADPALAATRQAAVHRLIDRALCAR